MKVLFSLQLLALLIISAECGRIPPDELRAVHLSPTSVFLKWKRWWLHPKSNEFEVYATTGDVETKVGSVFGKSFLVLEGLLGGTNYNITVAYVTDEGERLRSEELGIRTLDEEFPKPTDLEMSDFPEYVFTSETYTYETVWKFDHTNPLAENLTGFEVIDCTGDDCDSPHQAAKRELSLKRNLMWYTNYTVVVSALFKDREAVGTMFTFKTLKGRPRSVQNVEVHQKPDNLDLNITWSPPKRMNGLFKNYRVEIWVPKGERVVEGVPPPKKRSWLIAELYAIIISAYNTDDSGRFPEQGVRSWEYYSLKKPEPPRDLELKTCTPDSIEIEIERASEVDLRFEYTYAVHEKKQTNSSVLFFDGFETYQEVNVSVSACLVLDWGLTFCGSPKNKTFRTNVDTPSEVRNLNLTLNGAEPILSWETPEMPAGPIDGYVVLITDRTRNESSELIVPNASSEFHFVGVKNCTDYNLSVMAFNEDLVSGEKKNGTLSDSITYNSMNCEVPPRAPSIPTWAIVLIVAAVLSAAGGGALYYRKRRRGSPGQPYDLFH